METEGIEQSPLTPSKTSISQTQSAKNGALKDEIDPDLAEIVSAWPGLPGHIKTKIRVLVNRHTEKVGGTKNERTT